MEFVIRTESWALREPFVIARETMLALPLVHLAISHAGFTGQAEAAGVDYRGETPDSMTAEIQSYLNQHDTPPSRTDLLRDMPAGGARNAIDCALWDWEAKSLGVGVASLAGFDDLKPLDTAYTLSIGAPDDMAKSALQAPKGALLKIKLGGKDGLDLDRVAAIRGAAPDRRLVVDVNQGWTREYLQQAILVLAPLGIELIEQPLPVGEDGWLSDFSSPIPLCADESFDTLEDLTHIASLYSFINIKLDKSGGLTEALAIAKLAREKGLGLFIGSMLGTSLGMAPAFLVGQLCDYVDLDGALLLAEDRFSPMLYRGANIGPPGASLWG